MLQVVQENPLKRKSQETLEQYQSKKLKTESQISVLFVDDDSTARKIATFIFNKFPVELTLAENGDAALKLLEENLYDLIIIDYNMPPGMNGCKTVETWYSIKPETSSYNNTFILCSTEPYSENLRKECEKSKITTRIDKALSPKTIRKLFDENITP